MTEIANPAHRERWRVQAGRIAEELKAIPEWNGKAIVKFGIALDDAIITVKMPVAFIQQSSAELLAATIFEYALESIAAPQAPTLSGNAHSSPAPAGTEQPAAAAFTDTCRRKLEPDFTKQCENQATGGMRATLKPEPAVGKRWGMQSLLTFIIDLPVCASCFAKVNIFEVTDQAQRIALGRAAQQQNRGVLVAWDQTAIEHLPFEDPHYVLLRKQTRKANSQPGASGPENLK